MAQHPASTRGHHKALALTTAARLERMAAQVREDLGHDRPVSVPGLNLVTAAAVLMEELKAIEIGAQGDAAA